MVTRDDLEVTLRVERGDELIARVRIPLGDSTAMPIVDLLPPTTARVAARRPLLLGSGAT